MTRFVALAFASAIAFSALDATPQKAPPKKPRASTPAPSAPAVKTNRLASEKSPLLLDHSTDLVDWLPWSAQTLAIASRDNKPVFLVISTFGSSAGHRMQRESWTNPDIAAIVNRSFVPILVDPEERPDLTAAYGSMFEAMTGTRGDPELFVLAPDAAPLIAAGYVPPLDRNGSAGLQSLLPAVAAKWPNDEATLRLGAARAIAMARAAAAPVPLGHLPGAASLDSFTAHIHSLYDHDRGGFGRAMPPLRPDPLAIELLLYNSSDGGGEARDMAIETLRALAAGGIHDQLGGGFHHAAASTTWRMPHFEKMLCDQPLLADAYLDAFKITGDARFAAVARDTLDYIVRDLRDPSGALLAGEDSQSLVPRSGPEIVEGLFYLWKGDLVPFLDRRTADIVAFHYGLDPAGNVPEDLDPKGDFRKKNILFEAHSEAMTRTQFGLTEAQFAATIERARGLLFTMRQKQPRPRLDSTVVTAWNGLAIAALARGGAVLDEPRYLRAAEQAARFIETRAWDAKTQRLAHVVRGVSPSGDGFAADYAAMTGGCLALYEGTFNAHFLDLAIMFQQRQDALFWDETAGRYGTGERLPPAIAGTMPDGDDLTPPANALAAANLLRFGALSGEAAYTNRAARILGTLGAPLNASRQDAAPFGIALALQKRPFRIFAVAGDRRRKEMDALLHTLRMPFDPTRIIVFADASAPKPPLATWLPSLALIKAADDPRVFECTKEKCELVGAGAVK